jgi:hypothetical protein
MYQLTEFALVLLLYKRGYTVYEINTLIEVSIKIYKENRAVPRRFEAKGCTTTAAINNPTVNPIATETSCSATGSNN